MDASAKQPRAAATPPTFANPFRPGAGHPPPYLAGRIAETREFERLLDQDAVLENMVLTGLRGVGKTVLLDTLKPIAVKRGWLWVSADLSESASVSEQAMAIRLITDLAVVTSTIPFKTNEKHGVGFGANSTTQNVNLSFEILAGIFDKTPGLTADKLKAVLEFAWVYIEPDKRGVVFAYDEAQNLSDRAEKEQYPLSVLLDVFQSLQKKGLRYMLALTGLPTLFPKLVEARTFSERMFRVLFLNRLDSDESKDAILKPIADASCPVKFNDTSVDLIIQTSHGYPYFIQYICREAFDAFIQSLQKKGAIAAVPIAAIMRKLDTDFFAGRWARATDRQREMLYVIAKLPNCDDEFTVQEVVDESKKILEKPFSPSHTNQMLSALSQAGLVYKNRHGKYSFAVPLLGAFIIRQMEES